MKFVQFYLVMTLFGLTSSAFAKEAASPGASKPPVDIIIKREQVPELGADMRRFLRWHRDAMASRERDQGANVTGRYPFLQL